MSNSAENKQTVPEFDVIKDKSQHDSITSGSKFSPHKSLEGEKRNTAENNRSTSKKQFRMLWIGVPMKLWTFLILLVNISLNYYKYSNN